MLLIATHKSFYNIQPLKKGFGLTVNKKTKDLPLNFSKVYGCHHYKDFKYFLNQKNM